MPTVRDILARKGSHVYTVAPDTSVYDAARLMNEHKIGCVLVTEGQRLVGVFTERDILQRVVAARRDPVATAVRDVMTHEVACCRMHTAIEEARGVMKNRRIRHLPVCTEGGEIQGMVSIGDLNAQETHSQELTIHLLQQYIYGQV
jgi:CBS domain-containing protein